MKFIESEGFDPAWNLALEDYIFSTYRDGDILYIWRNEPCVIIGKNQYASKEVNTELAGKLNVPIIRRQTGGGAVYQDLGNVNFSYMTDAGEDELDGFVPRLTAAVSELGVLPEFNGRNDLLVNGFKISGSAAVEQNGRNLFHCTMLVRADIGKMAELLTPDESKLARNGVKSVGSRVKNLADFIPNVSTTMVVDSVKMACACEEKIELPSGAEDEIRAIMAKKYSNPKWNYSLF